MGARYMFDTYVQRRGPNSATNLWIDQPSQPLARPGMMPSVQLHMSTLQAAPAALMLSHRPCAAKAALAPWGVKGLHPAWIGSSSGAAAPHRCLAVPHQQQMLESSINGAETPVKFDWHKQWYPVRVVQELDPSVPHAVMLLGLRLVLWKEGDTWR